ncbi:MAG: hypothetical protein ABIP27_18000 [Flavobacterium circumlabens]|uniref:hypothetical protein n=1 Tax=Flavobacterium circumlabens TaxID=2133765 RepID=UPI003265A0C3
MKKCYLYLMFLASFWAYSQTSSSSILTSFHQGAATNCASISAIKLAIGKFGINNVLKEIKTTQTGFHITLKDNSEIDLSTSEILRMSKLNYFVVGSDKDIFDYAQFLYAVMASRKKQMYGINTIQRAATHRIFYHQLSMSTEENLDFLGLRDFVKRINKTDVENYDQIIITNKRHSVFCSKGIYDKFGTPTSVSLFEENHGNSPINLNDNYILN